MIEIGSNILVETEHLGSNNSIVVTPGGVVLIDTPHRATDAIRWRRQVAACGDVAYIINTDHHPDHTIGNFFLPGTIVSHEGTRERLQNAAPTQEYLNDLFAVIDPEGLPLMRDYQVRIPELTFSDRMTLHVGGIDFHLIHHRGHTLNSLYVHVPQLETVFSGDLVCELGLPAFIEADTFAWLDAIRDIEALAPRYIVPGHGKVCDVAEAVRFRGLIEDLIAEVDGHRVKGVQRSEIADLVSFEDRIHISTGGSPDYPPHLIELFMRKSIEAIYDHITARISAA